MKSINQLFFAIILFSSCASSGPMSQRGNGYNITSDEPINKTIVLGFESYQKQVAQNQSDSALYLWDSMTFAKNKRNIPQGGRIVVRINEYTMAYANPSNYTFIVLSDHQELVRQIGRFSIPSYNNGRYVCFDEIDIPILVQGRVTVIVICDIDKTKRTFYIDQTP